MKQTVRLAYEAVNGIKYLRDIYENELGLKIHQGYVIDKAYESVKGVDWLKVIETPLPKNLFGSDTQEQKNEKKTTLDINDEVVRGIEEMQEELPERLKVNWVTVGYCVRVIVKAAILKLEGEI